MKPYRTVISVPGHKPSWFDKAVAAGADCLCLDLEDSVPPAEKDDKALGAAYNLLRGVTVNANVPAPAKSAIPN